MHRVFVYMCLLALALATPSSALQYNIKDLGPMPDNSYCQAMAINSQGWVVGNYLSQEQGKFCGFLWKNGVLQDLSTLLGYRCEIYGINDHGDIVGVYQAGSYTHAFVYRDGHLTDLGVPTGHYSTAYGINESGVIVGGSVFPYSFCVWGGPTTVTPCDGEARAVNELGHVVGNQYSNTTYTRRAMLWSGTQITDLGCYGSGNSYAYAINDHDQIVGANGNGRAFLWQNNTLSDLGGFLGYGSTAFGINNSSRIAGVACTSSGGYRAFTWQSGTVQYLNLLPGGTQSQAFAINDNGWIAGTSLGSDNRPHAVLWTPVPEPSCLPTLLMGLGCVAAVSNGRRFRRLRG